MLSLVSAWRTKFKRITGTERLKPNTGTLRPAVPFTSIQDTPTMEDHMEEIMNGVTLGNHARLSGTFLFSALESEGESHSSNVSDRTMALTPSFLRFNASRIC